MEENLLKDRWMKRVNMAEIYIVLFECRMFFTVRFTYHLLFFDSKDVVFRRGGASLYSLGQVTIIDIFPPRIQIREMNS